MTKKVLNLFAPSKPHKGQQEVLDALDSGSRWILLRAGRKWRKTSLIISWLMERAISTGLVCPYIAPNKVQAKKICWDDHIQRILKHFKEIGFPYRTNEVELSVSFPELDKEGKIVSWKGGKVELNGVENKDALRGISNWGAVGGDEYDDWEEDIWPLIIRPNLLTHKAPALIAGCITKDSYILGKNGLEQIGETPYGYVSEDKELYGLGGWHKAEQRYGNGLSDTIKITSHYGFELEGTPNHKIWTSCGWKRLDNLSVNDDVSIQYGQKVFGNESISEDEAYLLGLFIAEGSWEINGKNRTRRVTITNPEVGDFLIRMGFNKQKDGIHFRSSKWFNFFSKYVSQEKAPQKYLLPEFFKLNEMSIKKILSGYFDGDGFSDSKKTRIGSTSSSRQLSRQIQLTLLNIGILAKMKIVVTPPTLKSRVSSTGYRLILEGHDCYLFYTEIGFGIKRKQDNYNHCVNKGKDTRKTKLDWSKFSIYGKMRTGGVNKKNNTVTIERARKLTKDELFIYDKIEIIEPRKSFTYDFVIPDTHSYFSNGFISHNTPKGYKNIYNIENPFDTKGNPTESIFRCFHFTSYDNPSLDQKELDDMVLEYKAMGMGYFRQEILAEYERPHGTVYEEWSENNYQTFDYDPFLPLHLSFDFGVNDPTAIIWIQPNNGEFRIIDYYEAADASIEHFVQVIRSKPYKRPDLCTGDAAGKARSITTNTSPIEEYSKLGIFIKTKNGLQIPDQIRITHKYIPSLFLRRGSTERLRECLLNYRYPEKRISAFNQSNELPIHDKWSHGCRALEYYFANIDGGGLFRNYAVVAASNKAKQQKWSI